MDSVTVCDNDCSSELSFIDDTDAVTGNANRIVNDAGEHPNDSKRSKRIPRVSIPGDFEFIDDVNPSPLSRDDVPISLQNGVDEPRERPKIVSPPVVFEIPSIYLPTNLQYIDDETESKGRQRGHQTHGSLRISRKLSTKRRLCRHHSDTDTKPGDKSRHHRGRSRKVRRSISAIETNKDEYRLRVRRSASDRPGMIMAGKHLLPPRCHYENASSRCSSTRTLSTNVSMSEVMAVEMGFKDIPGLTAKEARRRRVVCTVVVISVTMVIICVLLLAVTLLLSPEVDALIRKENEEIYRSMAAGASTSSPTTEGAAVGANNSAPPSGNPG